MALNIGHYYRVKRFGNRSPRMQMIETKDFLRLYRDVIEKEF